MSYTEEQKLYCVQLLLRGVLPRLVCQEFSRKYPPPVPNPTTASRWLTKFRKNGSVKDEKRSGRPSVPEEIIERVRQSFEENEKLSLRDASSLLNLKMSTVYTVVRKKLNLKLKSQRDSKI